MSMDKEKFWCPALDTKSLDYPVRFGGKTPKIIRMLQCVEPDRIPGLGMLPDCRGMIAEFQCLYPAWTNSYGAVSAILDDGRKLGVRPDEFEVVEYWEP